MANDLIGLAHGFVSKLSASLGLAPAASGPPRAQLLGRPGYGDQAAKVPAALATARTEQ